MKDKYIIVTDGCSFIDNNLIKKPPFKKQIIVLDDYSLGDLNKKILNNTV